jgi:hypothetical protein
MYIGRAITFGFDWVVHSWYFVLDIIRFQFPCCGSFCAYVFGVSRPSSFGFVLKRAFPLLPAEPPIPISMVMPTRCATIN